MNPVIYKFAVATRIRHDLNYMAASDLQLKKRNNYKLVSDPELKKGAKKIYRINGKAGEEVSLCCSLIGTKVLPSFRLRIAQISGVM